MEFKGLERLLFTAVNWEDSRIGLELGLSMVVDVERRLWRMFQIEKDKIGKWVKDKGKGQEFDGACW